MKLSGMKVGQKTNIKAGGSDSAKQLQQVLVHAKEIQDIYNKKIAPIVHKMGGGNMLFLDADAALKKAVYDMVKNTEAAEKMYK